MVKNPYKYTSDNLIFNCYALKNDISENEKADKFFSKGQSASDALPGEKVLPWNSS
ncbi:DUF6157 family protein [Chryseobacterium sp. RU37D]|uniref:DUF6157 family protein n=1 Tax=Chryseobacterium sp. RU37D TaxID=1907397 RepID=UPI003977C0FF